MTNKPNIVLVHGAWADGTSWSKIIPILHNAGYNVVATQHPLTSLTEDVEVTRRLAEAQEGPTILAGHSYGGAVITEAAHLCPNVIGLVYIAAFAPEVGENLGSIGENAAPPEGGAAIRPDKYGTLWLDKELFHGNFCQDVTDEEAIVMGAAQKPIAARCFGDNISDAGWKILPTWYQLSENDRMINPALQVFMTDRMKPQRVLTLQSSHVAMVSHPNEVADFILEACEQVNNLQTDTTKEFA